MSSMEKAIGDAFANLCKHIDFTGVEIRKTMEDANDQTGMVSGALSEIASAIDRHEGAVIAVSDSLDRIADAIRESGGAK